MQFHGVHHVALLCEDLDRSLKFYVDVLGARRCRRRTCMRALSPRPACARQACVSHSYAGTCSPTRSPPPLCCDSGLEVNPDRPHHKLPYAGAWLWIGPEMIHLMQLPNPDPLEGRPAHGGRDRHFCVGVQSIEPLEARLAVCVRSIRAGVRLGVAFVSGGGEGLSLSLSRAVQSSPRSLSLSPVRPPPCTLSARERDLSRTSMHGAHAHCCAPHACFLARVVAAQAAGVDFTRSMSGRPAVFFRDPDSNCLEVVEQGPWR